MSFDVRDQLNWENVIRKPGIYQAVLLVVDLFIFKILSSVYITDLLKFLSDVFSLLLTHSNANRMDGFCRLCWSYIKTLIEFILVVFIPSLLKFWSNVLSLFNLLQYINFSVTSFFNLFWLPALADNSVIGQTVNNTFLYVSKMEIDQALNITAMCSRYGRDNTNVFPCICVSACLLNDGTKHCRFAKGCRSNKETDVDQRS
jgi:hypothetical protein